MQNFILLSVLLMKRFIVLLNKHCSDLNKQNFRGTTISQSAVTHVRREETSTEREAYSVWTVSQIWTVSYFGGGTHVYPNRDEPPPTTLALWFFFLF